LHDNSQDDINISKIEATFQNERTWVLLFSLFCLVVLVLSSVVVTIIGFEIDPTAIILSFIIVLVILYGVPALLAGLIKPLLNTKVVLGFIDGKPVITLTCFLSKTVYKTPFEYDVMVTTLSYSRLASDMYFRLTIYGEDGTSVSLYEPMVSGPMIEGVEIETSNSIPFWGVLESTTIYPGEVWEIFQALENYPRGQKNTKLRLKSDEEFIDESPFQNSKNWV
jgi:hypothetical protein